jgi:Concanavalin A-like lectin/glucanases superfamily
MRLSRAVTIGALATVLVPFAGGAFGSSGAVASPAADTAASAADEASALAAARRSGVRVEVLGLRSATAEVFANPNGTLTEKFSLEPVRVQRPDKSWVPVDLTLRAVPGGLVAPAASPMDVRFSGGGDGPAVVMVSGRGQELSLKWRGRLPKPVLAGSTAVYREVLPGVDLQLLALPQGFSERVVVKTRQAALSPALSRIEFDAGGKGLTLRADRAGNLAAVDAGGGRVFSAPAPAMWDAQGVGKAASSDSGLPSSGQRKVGVRVAAGRLSLVPDSGMLTSPDTRFPVVIDPTFTYGNPAWTEVNYYDPNSSGWRTPDNTLAAGYQNYVPPTRVRSFMRFGVDSRVWGAHIVSADLSLYETWSAAHSCTASAVEVHVTGGFSSMTTWNHQPTWAGTMDSTTAAKGNPSNPCAADWVTFNATSGVVGAASHHTTLTIGLKAADEGEPTAWRKYAASGTFAPTLRVTYNHAPAVSKLVTSNPNSGCKTSSTEAVPVNITRLGGIRLVAYATDPDRDQVSVRFQFWHYGGVAPLVDTTIGPVAPDPTTHISTVSADILKNRSATSDPLVAGNLYTWKAFVSDGTDSSAWSQWCWLRYDPNRPDPPAVTSADYPSDKYASGAGTPGHFVFAPGDAADTDVVSYEYWIDSAPHRTVAANGVNPTQAPVDQYTTPTTFGPHDMNVLAKDAAANVSDKTTYHFYVNAANDAKGYWQFDEGFGTTAAGTPGGPMTLNGGVSWNTAGKADSALRFNGVTGEASVSMSEVDTSQAFSVCAWVKQDGSGHSMTAVSKAGTRSSGFYLMYDQPANRWEFRMTATDTDGPAENWASSQSAPVLGGWTHLCGVYESSVNNLTLYVNGVAQPVEHRTAIPWNAAGALRVGDMQWNGAAGNFLLGDVDEVRVYSRALFDKEIVDIVNHDNAHAPAGQWHLGAGTVDAPGGAVGRWPLDEGSGAAAAGLPGPGLTLNAGASWVAAGKLNKGLHFNGTTGEARSAGPAVDTGRDFSMCTWTRLSANDHSMVAISQGGTRSSAAYLMYVPGTTDRWAFRMAGSDADSPWLYWVYANAAPVIGQWTHLCGVYDASANRMSLYVNGVLQTSTGRGSPPWSATGDLRLGSFLWNGVEQNFLNGDVDDVRIYARVLSGDDVGALVTHDNGVTSGPSGDDSIARWQLDEGSGGFAGGSSGDALELNSGASWTTAGKVNSGLHLDGVSGEARTAGPVPGLDTGLDFSVCSWVRLSSKTHTMTVVGDAGTVSSAFFLQYSGTVTDRWQFRMARNDVSGSGEDWVASTSSPVVGQWTHLCGVYQAAANQLTLYVNGVSQGSVSRTAAPWTATGPVLVGDVQWDDATRNFLDGDVDEVRIYNRALASGDPARIADDVHGVGTDSSAANHPVGLTGGGLFTTGGHSGNGLTLDGVDDSASTSAAVVRTDQSFTVAAWVKLSNTDGEYTIVSQDGAVQAGFVLEYLPSSDYRWGVWRFAMDNTDPTNLTGLGAVITTPNADPTGMWTHLTASYDSFTRKLTLRLRDSLGTGLDFGDRDLALNAAGPLQIGRDKAGVNDNGSAVYENYLFGVVDEANLYAGVPSEADIRQLIANS